MSLAYATSPQPNYANPNAIGGGEIHRNAMALGSRLAAVTPVAKMKPDEQHAVINYKDGSEPLTKRLLQTHVHANGGPAPTHSMEDGIADTTYQDIHDKMHSGFARIGAKAPEDFSTFSGAGYELGRKIKATKTGEVFHAPAWISSSLNPQVAHSFADGDSLNESHVIQFKIPQGSQHGTYIGHAFGSFQHEFEYTIHAGTKWKKVRTVKHVQPTFDGTHTTYLHVMEPHVE